MCRRKRLCFTRKVTDQSARRWHWPVACVARSPAPWGSPRALRRVDLILQGASNYRILRQRRLVMTGVGLGLQAGLLCPANGGGLRAVCERGGAQRVGRGLAGPLPRHRRHAGGAHALSPCQRGLHCLRHLLGLLVRVFPPGAGASGQTPVASLKDPTLSSRVRPTSTQPFCISLAFHWVFLG